MGRRHEPQEALGRAIRQLRDEHDRLVGMHCWAVEQTGPDYLEPTALLVEFVLTGET